MDRSFLEKILITTILIVGILSCNSPTIESTIEPHLPIKEWQTLPLSEIKQDEVKALNADLVPDQLTMDVGIIVPSTFDPTFDLVDADKLLSGIRSAKEIFAEVDVQINLLWVKSVKLKTEQLAIMANRPPLIPKSKHLNAYDNMWRGNQYLSEQAETLFESLIEVHPENHRTIYLVALQEVFFNFFSETEAKDYELLNSPTSGLSFPPYIYGKNIPTRIRGVISICNLTRGENKFKTVAHELGHKAINVSHEYMDTQPGFEVIGGGGLMIYGSGVEIPSGKAGRWHKERLHLSPFIYKLNSQQQKVWNPDFKEKGHYFDPIYGEYAIRK